MNLLEMGRFKSLVDPVLRPQAGSPAGKVPTRLRIRLAA